MSATRYRIPIIVAVVVLIIIFGATAVYTFYTANVQQKTSSSVQTITINSVVSSTVTSTTASKTTYTISTGTNGYSSSWLTYHKDYQRTGYDANEPSIATSPPSVAW